MGAASKTLDAQLKALADPIRREILMQLANGEATVNEICAPHSISQPAISKHLKVLESAGLIVRRIEGQTRPCALAEGGLDVIDRFMEPLREAMERRYTKLDALLAKMENDDVTQAQMPSASSAATTKPRPPTPGTKKPHAKKPHAKKPQAKKPRAKKQRAKTPETKNPRQTSRKSKGSK